MKSLTILSTLALMGSFGGQAYGSTQQMGPACLGALNETQAELAKNCGGMQNAACASASMELAKFFLGQLKTQNGTYVCGSNSPYNVNYNTTMSFTVNRYNAINNDINKAINAFAISYSNERKKYDVAGALKNAVSTLVNEMRSDNAYGSGCKKDDIMCKIKFAERIRDLYIQAANPK